MPPPTPCFETSITLYGSPPWGFRLSGGKDEPLVITRVTPGTIGAKSGLTAGDVILAINGDFVSEMTQEQCETKLQQAVKHTGGQGSLYLVLKKNAASITTDASGQVVIKLNKDESKHGKSAGSSHNRSAQGYKPSTGPPTAPRPVRVPMSNPSQAPTFDPSILKRSAANKQGMMVMQGPGKSKVVHAQYNTPMGMYSNENIIDTVQAQAQSMGVSLPGAGGDSSAIDPNSAVYREVHRQQAAPKSRSAQSRSFKMLQSFVDTE